MQHLRVRHALLGRLDQRGQPVHQEGPVVQARQVVVEGRELQPLLDQLALADLGFERAVLHLGDAGARRRFLGQAPLADVALHRHPMREEAPLVGHRHDAELNPELAAILAHVQQLDLDGLPSFQRGAQAVERLAVRMRRLQEARRAAQHFGFAVAGGAGEGGVAVDDPRTGQVDRLGFGDEDGVVGVHHHGFQQAQPLRPRLLRVRVNRSEGAASGGQCGAELQPVGDEHIALGRAEPRMGRRVGHQQHAAGLHRDRGDEAQPGAIGAGVRAGRVRQRIVDGQDARGGCVQRRRGEGFDPVGQGQEAGAERPAADQLAVPVRRKVPTNCTPPRARRCE